MRRVVEILLRDCLLPGQWSVAVHVELRASLIRFRHCHLRFGLRQLSFGLRHLSVRLRELALRLIHRRLERTRIDLKQRLPPLHEGSFDVILL